ncbi:hypothetical protein [Rhizorhabdus dicambivorans]|uniref:Uncharacterized protein n=1 Tax=Rhizorhabdus dicambivorans TaxID=1850238 RepID=A0A2A4FR07_9SPHN|nr:hypothetical protein [Rhizorhabdus dicambivorans]ATE65439.1 hypothetical protein CMV14_14365 [Rhizorhabdus dicambivorans]PCE40597.1 hypothetical protein COO09_19260 [Rhizorhabdus dicambivorans]
MAIAPDFRRQDVGGIPLEMLRRYLVARHWNVAQQSFAAQSTAETAAARALLGGRSTPRRNFDVYLQPADTLDGVELVVPNDASAPGYQLEIERAVRILAEVEERTPAEVAASIRAIGFDVIRSRIPDGAVLDDTIRLEVARNYVLGIRQLLAATATTELHPEPFFLRVRKEASEYADRCRFGHTFKGSFGFTIESPLEPNLEPTFDGIQRGPFERRVVERFAKGIAAVCQAATKDDPAWIVESAKAGFGANACELLAAMIEETSYTALTFEFSLSPEWVTELPPEDQTPFVVGPRHVEISRAAAKALRTRAAPRDETVFGRVVKLATQADPSDLLDVMGEREIAVLWSSESLGDITVRLSLDPEAYLLAVEAHATGRPIRVSGSLEQRGRQWLLSSPTGFAVP